MAPPKDLDTYIHRAGRTARAGRSGVCVTFYAKKQQDLLDRIERKARIKFQKIGAPQPTDIIKANSRDIVTSIQQVPKEVVDLFKDISQELVDKLGTTQALSRALAIISGTNEMFKQRSLLCSIEGFVTYIVETDTEFRSPSYVWGFLKRHFPIEVTSQLKGMRSFKNKRGAAFDVPEQFDKDFIEFNESGANTKGYTLKKADKLPEFEEEYGGGGGGYGQGGSSNGYGGNRDSRVLKSKDDCKVFIGGLPYDIKEDDVKEFFEKEGFKPEDVLLLRDNEGASKGVAFAIFANSRDAEQSTKLSGKRLGHRSLRINMANDKPDGRGRDDRSRDGGGYGRRAHSSGDDRRGYRRDK
jgi:ATP-dependent RNA helicase DDX21